MYQRRYNPQTQRSKYFRLSSWRRRHVQDLVDEYLNMLAILYGGFLLSGEKRISEFSGMTMQHAAHELKVRTALIRAREKNRRKVLREEHQAAEDALLEELKRSTQ